MIRRVLLIGVALACTSQAIGEIHPEQALVRLVDVDTSIQQAVRYAGPDNFVGETIDGYLASQIMLTLEAAAALSRAQQTATEKGLSLLVYDGYRPQRAVDHFVRWGKDLSDIRRKPAHYPAVAKSELFERGYIAERSGHSRGSTVDVTLTANGKPLDMGTAFDFFGAESHTDSPDISLAARANRRLLVNIMAEAGFRNYPREWWHYTLINEPYPDTYFDMPIK